MPSLGESQFKFNNFLSWHKGMQNSDMITLGSDRIFQITSVAAFIQTNLLLLNIFSDIILSLSSLLETLLGLFRLIMLGLFVRRCFAGVIRLLNYSLFRAPCHIDFLLFFTSCNEVG